MTRVRLGREERKEEILEAAARLFREKGFLAVTMEDVVRATTLSKGGIYHYYANTTEMLSDLMEKGIAYRTDVMKKAYESEEDMDPDVFFAEMLFEKTVSDHPYTEIYAQFLMAKARNEELEELFQKLKERTKVSFVEAFGDQAAFYMDAEAYDLVTDLVNAMILATTTLGARERFLSHREELVHGMTMTLREIHKGGRNETL